MTRAVLFDFDGVLGKTMEDNFAAWQAALSDFGATLTSEEYYPYEGVALPELAKRYCLEKNIDSVNIQAIIKKKEAYYLAHHVFELYPGVEVLVDRLHAKKIPMAIVTTGLRDRIARSVPPEFLAKFTIVTGEETKRGKPFPDPYLKGAEKIGVPIAECVVVENAPAGVEAAKSAGAYCIAICSTLGPDILKSADEIIGAFTELANSETFRKLLE
jgi:beta-phosphoglucomutase